MSSELPVLNIPLLRKHLDRLSEMPVSRLSSKTALAERFWKQGIWAERRDFEQPFFSQGFVLNEKHQTTDFKGNVCKTACCLAGDVCIETAPAGSQFSGLGNITLPNGTDVSCCEWARNQLGLTEDQANSLFAGSNTREEMLDIAESFIAEAEARY